MLRQFSAIAMLAIILAGCGQQQRPHMTPMAGYIVIKEQPVSLIADLPGRTSPTAVSDVRPQVNGIIKARLFVEGSTVKVGQPLYQIDPAPYQAAFDSANAALANAQASLATTRAKSERFASLLKQNAIAPQEYDDALAAWKQAAGPKPKPNYCLNGNI